MPSADSPLCSLFTPTPFQTQTFSRFLERASLRKWQLLNKSLYNVGLGAIKQTLALFLSFFFFCWLLFFKLLAFLHRMFLLTLFSFSLPQWVGTQFLITMGDWVYKSEDGRGEARERGTESLNYCRLQTHILRLNKKLGGSLWKLCVCLCAFPLAKCCLFLQFYVSCFHPLISIKTIQ